ncbi:wiskott-Aldrich syndrome protein family member 1-like [Cervus canadensis]|uniref:wiskott-Aldrich syndrome protein family member 1-like n=1 Tax=Cervus canadensis TaxID=1574408 RepID=UPI001C9E80B9|nr:wiskott-Aldrich syndrome protein family member 1-like [Cervus canadensis]
MEAKYSAISHPPPPPPTPLPTPTTPPDARRIRHPDATTLVPPHQRGGAAQSGEALSAHGRGLARAGGAPLAVVEPARRPPAPPPGSRYVLRARANAPSALGWGPATSTGVPQWPEKPSAQSAASEEAAAEGLFHAVPGPGP